MVDLAWFCRVWRINLRIAEPVLLPVIPNSTKGKGKVDGGESRVRGEGPYQVKVQRRQMYLYITKVTSKGGFTHKEQLQRRYSGVCFPKFSLDSLQRSWLSLATEAKENKY